MYLPSSRVARGRHEVSQTVLENAHHCWRCYYCYGQTSTEYTRQRWTWVGSTMCCFGWDRTEKNCDIYIYFLLKFRINTSHTGNNSLSQSMLTFSCKQTCNVCELNKNHNKISTELLRVCLQHLICFACVGLGPFDIGLAPVGSKPTSISSAGARGLEACQTQMWGPLFTDRGVRGFFHRLWVVLWWQTAPKWAWSR